ncbi:PSD1 and planctomycete cytochrome C domain-containing protein [uncultured Kriegella sp.]|uniref:PSD1 and planctomycete cytochrome C domain-containing protein n=1 Tax=uncultured Kriegella sp. TaxID=1798910 RepID=UPI0030D9C572|tara:strand:- start:154756 stop:157746 length:2991 start_codon:yes stop_codon:yes gene_type:complete
MLSHGKRFFLIGLVLSVMALQFSCGDSKQYAEPLPETVDFNFHIKPILVQNCYLCHGPDVSSRKANLRLDILEGATAELEDGGHAVVPGKPSRSLLVARINNAEEDMMMPPPDSNLKLTEREKALLEKWIDQGAEWKEHWAFIKPITEKATTDPDAIDNFIDKQLAQKGLEKSPVADKNALIRRVAYLITGLPPSPADVESFTADDSQDAYEKMVDRYLNSPAYGERWARHWMDLVRYAETKGHEFDYTITGAWKYRDYLIRAFNEDIAYNQLLKEHLAGDLIEKKRYDSASGNAESPLGTAFYAMGEGTHSPVDIRQDEADRIDNMIDVTSKTFQGLTVSCAKCHDHKFDPISAADYYAFYGIMESTRFSPVPADLSLDDEKNVKAVSDLKTYMRQLVADEWADGLKSSQIEEVKQNGESKELNTNEYKVLGDFRNTDLDGWISDGIAFGQTTTLGDPIVDRATGKLMELEQGRASSKTFGTGVFGVLRSPNLVLDTDFIGVKARGINSTVRIVIDNFQLIQNPIYGNMAQKVGESKWNNYVFNVGPWKGHKAYIEILPGEYNRHDYALPSDAYVETEYAIAYDSLWPKEIEHRLPVSQLSPKSSRLLAFSPKRIESLNGKLKKGQLSARIPELKTALDSSLNLQRSLVNTSFFYGVNEGIGINSPIFNRGSYQELSEEKVPRRFLSALPLGDVPFKSKGSGRLELAEAMLNEDNPLTSRVMVNRIWHHLFGKGIVETVDNFGLQGKLPSHPKLLDYLAVKFQEDGWSIKKMIRHIVTSEVFKRSAVRSDALTEKDPTNKYLASFPVRRLESEAIRDALLVVSGSMDSTLYGPPVKTHLTEFMQGRGRPGKSGPLDGAGRRSIYQEVRRNFLEPMMVTFDRPIPFSTFGRRNVTNVPSQSLIIMNDPFVAQQAERMAKQLLSQKDLTFDEKIAWIYMRTFSRKPSAEELSKAASFIEVLGGMENQAEEGDLDKETSIWKDYCHSIFNLKEFIYLI